MATSVYDPLANTWLDILQSIPCFASLHFEVPSTDNPLASECDSPTYARAPLTWTPGTSRVLMNYQRLEWLNVEDTTIIGVGACGGATGGQLLLFFQLDEPVPIAGRGSWSLGAGELYVHI